MRQRAPYLSDEVIDAQTKHWLELEKELGIKKKAMMSIEDADKQSANPKYQPEYIKDENGIKVKNPQFNEGYDRNCATCTPAYMLRLHGFDVVAKPKIRGSMVEKVSRGEWLETFKNTDGSSIKISSTREWAESKGYKSMTAKRYKSFYDESCKDTGVYYVSIQWKGGGGHATILQRHADGILEYIEPQVDNSNTNRQDLSSLVNNQTTILSRYVGVFRIDDKLFNVKYSSIFDKGSSDI